MASLLAFPCIAPHGGVALEELGNPRAARAEGTRRAMAELRERARRAALDAWIVLAPHGIRVAGCMAVSDAEAAVALLEPEGDAGRRLRFEAAVHRDMACALAERSLARGVPAVRVTDGRGCYPMDWSGAIPLWFLGAGRDQAGALPVVQVVPSTDLGWQGMVRFGQILGAFCEERPERIGLIASSDLAHAHDPQGPYGRHAAAAAYDSAVCEAIEANDPMRLLSFEPDTVRDARVDGQWQILALAGALLARPTPLELLCYEVPTYFGMLTAGPRAS